MYRPLWSKLTDREQMLMGWAKTGLGFTEVAQHIGLSVNVVKNYMHAIYLKIGADNRTHAVVMLLEEKFAAEKQELECTSAPGR
jgi:DNA-binding CsgD family transcriptional regulator